MESLFHHPFLPPSTPHHLLSSPTSEPSPGQGFFLLKESLSQVFQVQFKLICKRQNSYW